MIDKVRDYIRNQEEHHKRTTFQSEYEEFIKKNGAKEKNKYKTNFFNSHDLFQKGCLWQGRGK